MAAGPREAEGSSPAGQVTQSSQGLTTTIWPHLPCSLLLQVSMASTWRLAISDIQHTEIHIHKTDAHTSHIQIHLHRLRHIHMLRRNDIYMCKLLSTRCFTILIRLHKYVKYINTYMHLAHKPVHATTQAQTQTQCTYTLTYAFIQICIHDPHARTKTHACQCVRTHAHTHLLTQLQGFSGGQGGGVGGLRGFNQEIHLQGFHVSRTGRCSSPCFTQ